MFQTPFCFVRHRCTKDKCNKECECVDEIEADEKDSAAKPAKGAFVIALASIVALGAFL